MSHASRIIGLMTCAHAASISVFIAETKRRKSKRYLYMYILQTVVYIASKVKILNPVLRTRKGAFATKKGLWPLPHLFLKKYVSWVFSILTSEQIYMQNCNLGEKNVNTYHIYFSELLGFPPSQDIKLHDQQKNAQKSRPHLSS